MFQRDSVIVPESHQKLREDFHVAHGGDAVCRFIQTYMVYPDGARMYQDPMHGPEEPPANDFQRLQIILQYRKVRLHQATENFNTRKGQLTSQCNAAARNNAVAPNDAQIEELKQLQVEVRNWQQQVQETETALATTNEARRQRADEDQKATARAAAADAAAKISLISI